MNKTTGLEIVKFPTLSTVVWSEAKFKSWKGSERSVEPAMRRFIYLNRKNFDFLGISTFIITKDDKPALQFTTSNFSGAIPLISPKTGKPIGNIEITGRFGEDIGELIPLIESEIKPEFSDQARLMGNTVITPPIFLECCKFIDIYSEAERINWRKFDNELRIERAPASSTLWKEYATRVATNPASFGLFKNKKNILTTDHNEWAQLNYVLKIAIGQLEGQNVPKRIKILYKDKINRLKIKLQEKRVVPTDKVVKRMSDPLIIKQLKDLANIILNNKSNENLSWRFDYNEFFERYVQYLFSEIAKMKGAQLLKNPHYAVRFSNNLAWSLRYLEPDMVLKKDSRQLVIDAKYKSHIYNRHDNNENLKEVFRHDLHQILAYASFNPNLSKKAMLVYPFSDFKYYKMTIDNPLSKVGIDVYLIGVPLSGSKIRETLNNLNNIVSFL